MKFDQNQLNLISKYFSDISKVIFVSTVLGFLIPSESLNVSWFGFIIGSISTLATIMFGVGIAKQNKI